MPFVDNTRSEVDASFAKIADADIDTLLKQLTQDEKVSLLTGERSMFAGTPTMNLTLFESQAKTFGIPFPFLDWIFPQSEFPMVLMESVGLDSSAVFPRHVSHAALRSVPHSIGTWR